MRASTCAATMSGLTTVPQSTAATTRCTRSVPSAIERDLRDFGDVAAERLGHRDAPRPARRQRRAPARLLGGQLEHRLCGGACFVQQRAAELDRVLARGRGQLVDEALDDERRSARSPPSARSRAAPPSSGCDPRRRGSESRRAGSRRPRPSGHRARPGRAEREADRGADDPGGRRQRRCRRRPSCRGERAVRRRAGSSRAGCRLPAAPHHLHRRAGGLGGLHRVDDEVAAEAPAEPAAQEVVWTSTLSGSEPGDARRGLLRAGRRAVPHWYWVGAQTVQRRPRTCAVAFIGSMQACAR